MFAEHHLGQQLPRDVEKAVQRGGYHVVPVLVGHHKHHVVLADAGIVHQIGDVVVGVSLLPLVKARLHLGLAADIKLHQLRLSASGLNGSLHVLRGLLVGDIVDDDGNAHAGNLLADGLPQPSGTSCYKCIFHISIVSYFIGSMNAVGIYAVETSPIFDSETTTRCWPQTRATRPSTPLKSPSTTRTISPLLK